MQCHDNRYRHSADSNSSLGHAGRHVQLKDKPMTNLDMAMLERMNVKAERHGDSTGVLKNI